MGLEKGIDKVEQKWKEEEVQRTWEEKGKGF